jgi:hypothetical protein
METQTDPTASNTSSDHPKRTLMTLPVLAGIAYTLAWIVGLAVWPANLDVAASGAQVLAAYTGHQGQAMLQYFLVEGVAAVALAGVVLALGRAARRRGAVRLGRVSVAFGVGAAILSLVQCALGLVLAGQLVPSGDAGQAAFVFALISRLDGVKMFGLAALAVAGVGLALRVGVLPRWLGFTGILLAVALLVSGVGYLLLNTTLALAAAVSLALLLVWVTGAGISLARASR